MTHQLRHSTLFFLLCSLGILTILILAVHAASASGTARAARAEQLQLVRSLRLTDLCLFTEARYTRHPSMADQTTPFQDHPMSLEHFPSGALVPVPSHLNQRARN
jgi:hypothetical protein